MLHKTGLSSLFVRGSLVFSIRSGPEACLHRRYHTTLFQLHPEASSEANLLHILMMLGNRTGRISLPIEECIRIAEKISNRRASYRREELA
jgi:hypothetical protein